MVLHFNEAKAYKGTVAINVRNSLLVALMKHTRHFWQHYCDLLRVSGKEKSDSTELHKVMKELAMKPKKRKVNAKKKKKILQKIELDFDIGLKDLEESFENLEEVEESDETLLYRAMMDLVEIYDDIWAAHHLPEHRHHEILHHLYHIMEHISGFQDHVWQSSKARPRGFPNIEEFEITNSKKIRRKMRRQTIELDHVTNRIEPLQRMIHRLKAANTQKEIHELQVDINKLLSLYQTEIGDIHHILHEAHVFTRRTEKLFNFMAKEAEELGEENLKRKIEKYSHKFHEIHEHFEILARREALDIKGLLKSVRKPPKLEVKKPEARHRSKSKKAA